MEDPVVITAAVRTATGAYQGVFKDVAAQALGTAVIAATLTWSGMDPKDVGEVYLGNVQQSLRVSHADSDVGA